VNVGETPCLVDNWMRIIFALVFVGGVDSALGPLGDLKATTEFPEDYWNEIKRGRTCEEYPFDYEFDGWIRSEYASDHKYFRCRANAREERSDVVVMYSNQCLFQFHFTSSDGKFVETPKWNPPEDAVVCLDLKDFEATAVNAGPVSLDANRIATVKCLFDKKLLGEYKFKWGGNSDKISHKQTENRDTRSSIAQAIGIGAQDTDKYSVERANKLCDSFLREWNIIAAYNLT
jgi:hypothetical protein